MLVSNTVGLVLGAVLIVMLISASAPTGLIVMAGFIAAAHITAFFESF